MFFLYNTSKEGDGILKYNHHLIAKFNLEKFFLSNLSTSNEIYFFTFLILRKS